MNDQNSAVTRLLEDVFGLVDDEIQCDAAHTYMVSCADQMLTEAQSREQQPLLWRHLSQCIDCMDEYTLLMESVAREAAGTMYTTKRMPVRPNFADSQPSARLPDAVQAAMTAGKQWVYDQVDTLYIMVGKLIQDQQQVAWGAQRSTAKRYRLFVEDPDLNGWELEVSAVEEGAATYLFEVALDHAENADAKKEKLPILLQYGDTIETAYTDSMGVATFTTLVPANMLEQVVIRFSPHSDDEGA